MSVSEGDSFKPALNSDSFTYNDDRLATLKAALETQHNADGTHKFLAAGGLEYSSGMRIKLNATNPLAALSASGLKRQRWEANAIVGSSAHADYSTIASAISGGATSILLEGSQTHTVGASVTLPDDFTMWGMGHSTVVNISAGAYHLACGERNSFYDFKVTGSPTNRAFYCSEKNRLTMDNIWFDLSAGDCVLLAGATSSYDAHRFENCYFDCAATDYGLYVYGVHTGIVVSACHFTTCRYGITLNYSGAENIVIEGCQFISCDDYAILGTEADNVHVIGCYIYTGDESGVSIGTNSSNWLVTGTIIEDMTKYGIYCDGDNCRFVHNLIDNPGEHGIRLGGNSDRCIAAGNLFKDIDTGGGYTDVSDVGSNNVDQDNKSV